MRQARQLVLNNPWGFAECVVRRHSHGRTRYYIGFVFGFIEPMWWIRACKHYGISPTRPKLYDFYGRRDMSPKPVQHGDLIIQLPCKARDYGVPEPVRLTRDEMHKRDMVVTDWQ